MHKPATAKKEDFLPASMFIAWGTCLAASAASVYFIEILHEPAATLCWVDRMLIFSLFLLLTVAIIIRDRSVWRYTIPFLIIGLPSSGYQQLVHWGILPVQTQTCSENIVCAAPYFTLFGFITQATLCFVAFIVIAIAMWCLSAKRIGQ